MKLIRAVFFMLAVLVPTSWTIAHAAEGTGGSSGEKKSKKKSKKKESGEPKSDSDTAK